MNVYYVLLLRQAWQQRYLLLYREVPLSYSPEEDVYRVTTYLRPGWVTLSELKRSPTTMEKVPFEEALLLQAAFLLSEDWRGKE